MEKAKQDMPKLAQAWIDSGFSGNLIWLEPGTKAPKIPKWSKLEFSDKELLRNMAQGYNLGLRTKECVALDIEGTEHAQDIMAIIKRRWPDAPIRKRNNSTSRGVLLRFIDPVSTGVDWCSGGISEDDGSPTGRKLFEVLGAGRQFHVGGFRSDAQNAWLLWNKQPVLDQLPGIDIYDIQDLLREIEQMLVAKGVKLKPVANKTRTGRPNLDAVERGSCEEISRVLKLMPNGTAFDDRNAWIEVLHGVYGASDGSEGGRDLWLDWCETVPQGRPEEPARVWDTINPENVRSGMGILWKWAQQLDPQGAARLEFENVPFEEISLEREDKLKLNWEIALRKLRLARDEPGHLEALAGVDSVGAGRGGFITLDGGCLGARPVVPPDITDWHTRGQAQMLTANPFTGKSTLMLLWALAIVCERPDLTDDGVIDWAGDVVFISNEDGAAVLRAKLQGLLQMLGLKYSDFKHNIHVWSQRLPLVSKTGRDGVAPTGEAIRMVAKLGELRAVASIALVVVDTFASANDGGDENSVADTQPVMNAAIDIARAGFCSVALVHHNNKAGEVRGSSAIAGAVRFRTTLRRCDPGKETGWTPDECERRVCFELAEGNNRRPKTNRRRYFEFSSVNLVADDPRNPGAMASMDVGVLTLIPPPVLRNLEQDIKDILKLDLVSGVPLTMDTSERSASGVFKHIRTRLGLPKNSAPEVEKLVRKLIAEGVFKTRDGRDKSNNEKTFIEVGDAPAQAENGSV